MSHDECYFDELKRLLKIGVLDLVIVKRGKSDAGI